MVCNGGAYDRHACYFLLPAWCCSALLFWGVQNSDPGMQWEFPFAMPLSQCWPSDTLIRSGPSVHGYQNP